MLHQLFGWLFRTFTPYLLGVCIGVGFFFLLIRFTSGPDSLVWNYAGAGFSKAQDANQDAVAETAPEPVKPTAAVETAPAVAEPAFAPVQSSPVAAIQPPPPAAQEPPQEVPVISVAAKPEPPVAPQQQVDDGPVKSAFNDAYQAHRAQHGAVTPPPVKPELFVDESVAVAEAERSVVAKTPVESAPAPAAPKSDVQVNCGTAPRYPGPEMDRFMACQWRNNCLANRTRTLAMLAQGRNECVMSGRNPVQCRDYFAAIEKRTNLESCNNPQAGYPVRRW